MNDTKTVTLQVSGMIRATSKNVTEAHLARQPGVISVDANPVSQTATVTYDPQTTSVAYLQQWVIECGYHCAGQSVPDHICDPTHEPHDHATTQGHDTHVGHGGHEARTDHGGHPEHAGHEPHDGHEGHEGHQAIAADGHDHVGTAVAGEHAHPAAGAGDEHAGHPATAADGHDHGTEASGHSAQEMMGHGGHVPGRADPVDPDHPVVADRPGGDRVRGAGPVRAAR